jgi:predicted nucleic acid-binding Zn ribbon protein
MGKHNEHTMKEAFEQLLRVYKLDDKIAQSNIISSWETVMGSVIAKHTKEVFINKQQLYVVLDSAALRNELSMAKSKIITMLNASVGKEVINDIIFK